MCVLVWAECCFPVKLYNVPTLWVLKIKPSVWPPFVSDYFQHHVKAQAVGDFYSPDWSIMWKLRSQHENDHILRCEVFTAHWWTVWPCVVGTAHSSFLSGCDQMPAVVSPCLSLTLFIVHCVYGPWAEEKALGWPGLKAPMWASSGSCPSFIILTTASGLASTSLASSQQWPNLWG